MRILDLACKDILQILRDWKSALFLLVMPILFTVFFGLVFGPTLSATSERSSIAGRLDQSGSGRSAEQQPGIILNQSDVIRLAVLEGDKADQACAG